MYVGFFLRLSCWSCVVVCLLCLVVVCCLLATLIVCWLCADTVLAVLPGLCVSVVWWPHVGCAIWFCVLVVMLIVTIGLLACLLPISGLRVVFCAYDFVGLGGAWGVGECIGWVLVIVVVGWSFYAGGFLGVFMLGCCVVEVVYCNGNDGEDATNL